MLFDLASQYRTKDCMSVVHLPWKIIRTNGLATALLRQASGWIGLHK